MNFEKLNLQELQSKIDKEDFVLVIEETKNSATKITDKPEEVIKTLIEKINTFEPCSQIIYYYLNENKEEAKIKLGLVTKDETNLMYWENKKPKFSFYLEEALQIFN